MIEQRWTMLAVLLLSRTAMGFQFQSIASTEFALRQRFDIGFAEIGTLIGIYMMPGILLAMPGGLLVRRFGDKTIACIGLLLMAFGSVLIGISPTYYFVMASRLMTGMGAVLISLAVSKMVTDWFAGREIVVAMSVMLTSWPFGVAAGLVVFAPLAQSTGWASVMYLTAAVCLDSLFLVAVLYRSPAENAVQILQPVLATTHSLSRAEAIPVVIAAIAWGALNVGLIVLFSFVPPLLVTRGLTLSEGASLTSVSLWLTLLTMPLGGLWLQRRARPEGAIIICSGLLGLIFVALALFPVWQIPLLIAIGIVIGPPPGAIMAMPGRVLQPANRAVGFGLFLTFYYIHVTGGPIIAGMLKDVYGPAAPVLFGAFLFVSIIPLTMAYRRALRV